MTQLMGPLDGSVILSQPSVTTRHFDDEFRRFLRTGSGWLCIPSKEKGKSEFAKGKPTPPKYDLPFITVLRTNTRHIGIPYRVMNETMIVVDVVSLYSVQFFGDEYIDNSAMDRALLMSLWVYGAHAEAYSAPFKFAVLDCSEAREVTSIVNGIWEDRVVMNMRVKHMVVLSQAVDVIEEVPIEIQGVADLTVRSDG